MKNIRQNIFETNSSSSHSISLSSDSDGLLDTIYTDVYGTIHLDGGEYGWGYEKFNDSLTKANYCLVDSLGNQNKLEMLISVIKEVTGAKEVNIDKADGYIDHESVGTSTEAFSSKESLKNFIFNSKSWLYIGNDNSANPPNFFDDPSTEYKFELKLDGATQTAKFKDVPTKKELEDTIISLVDSYHMYNGKYSFVSYQVSSNDGKVIGSFDRLEENIILLINYEPIYNKKHSFEGYHILDVKEAPFKILPIIEDESK